MTIPMDSPSRIVRRTDTEALAKRFLGELEQEVFELGTNFIYVWSVYIVEYK